MYFRALVLDTYMLLNCGVGEDSWESLGLQEDPISSFWRRSALRFLWKEWCYSWNSSCDSRGHKESDTTEPLNWLTDVYNYCLPDGFFLSLRKCPSLFIIPFLSYILSHLIWIQPLHLFLISVCMAYFPHFFTFKLFTSLNLKFVFCTQCIVRLWILEIYSANLCLLIGGVIPFTLSVVQIIYNLLWFYCLFSICLMSFLWASLVAQTVKNPPAIQETWVQSLGGEDPPEKGMVPTPVFLPREFHGQRNLVGTVHEVAKSQTYWGTNTSYHFCSCVPLSPLFFCVK